MKFSDYLKQNPKSVFDHRPHGVRDLEPPPTQEEIDEADKPKDDHEKKD